MKHARIASVLLILVLIGCATEEQRLANDRAKLFPQGEPDFAQLCGAVGEVLIERYDGIDNKRLTATVSGASLVEQTAKFVHARATVSMMTSGYLRTPNRFECRFDPNKAVAERWYPLTDLRINGTPLETEELDNVNAFAEALATGIFQPAVVSATRIGTEPAEPAVLVQGQIASSIDNELLRSAERVVIDSQGGLLFWANSLIPDFDHNKTTVFVPNGAQCFSACLILMAAADRVYVGTDAEFLLHAASHFGEYSEEGTAIYRQILTDYDWPQAMLDEGVQADAELTFNGVEAVKSGVADGFVCGEIADPSSLHLCSVAEAGI